jgi:hypothetical protein
MSYWLKASADCSSDLVAQSLLAAAEKTVQIKELSPINGRE